MILSKIHMLMLHFHSHSTKVIVHLINLCIVEISNMFQGQRSSISTQVIGEGAATPLLSSRCDYRLAN